jgi:hypothetical protein
LGGLAADVALLSFSWTRLDVATNPSFGTLSPSSTTRGSFDIFSSHPDATLLLKKCSKIVIVGKRLVYEFIITLILPQNGFYSAHES